MAFSVQTLRRVLRCSSFSAARWFSVAPHRFSVEKLDSDLRDIKTALSQTVLPLKTSFHGRYTYISARTTGFFLEPGLIATSARAVGRLTTSYEPRTAEKPDRFEHGRICHRSVIGSTVALTSAGKILETKPLAVSFSTDLAVLKVVNPDGECFPHCDLASSAPQKGELLLSVFHRGSSDSNPESVVMVGKVRETEERTIMEKPPWPMDDRSGWLEYDWSDYEAVKHPVFSWEELDGSIGAVSGSPWFNICCEVVGIASWEAVNESSGYSLGFAVPSSWIGVVLEYAKTKGSEDPIVMDRWINA